MEQREFDWLNKEFLIQCLQKEEGMENVVVTNFSAVPAVPPGYNYISVLSRVRVDYRHTADDEEHHSVSLIIKSELTDDAVKDLVSVDVKVTEGIFYDKFLTAVGKRTVFLSIPKYFKSSLGDIIVLEDLDERGFVNIDKTASLDFDHCRMYLVAIASHHAVSFVVHKEIPSVVEYIGKEKWFVQDQPHSEMFRNMTRSGCRVFIDAIQRTERFEKYKGIVKRVTADLWDRVIRVRNEPSQSLNVLNHGDAWVANMMFRYDKSGAPEDIAVLDFQFLKYGSPACDLVHFLWTSATHEVRKNRLEDLYHVYLDTFNRKLEELGCSDRLSYENFKADINRFSVMALFIVGIMQPYKRDPNPIPIQYFVEKESNEEAKRIYDKWYEEDYTNHHFPNLLQALESAGVFEYLEKTVKT